MTSILPAEEIFHISTDIQNFHHVLPKYFESLEIIEDRKYEKIVVETIHFLGFSAKVKTQHLIIPPNVHHVYILSGPLKGSSFNESYNATKNGSEIIIDVTLKIFGFKTIFSFLNNYIIDQMSIVMNEFVIAAENKFNYDS